MEIVNRINDICRSVADDIGRHVVFDACGTFTALSGGVLVEISASFRTPHSTVEVRRLLTRSFIGQESDDLLYRVVLCLLNDMLDQMDTEYGHSEETVTFGLSPVYEPHWR